MANPEHLKILKQRADVWNDWRKTHPQTIPDLSKADLRGMELSAMNLSKANLRKGGLPFF